MRTTTIALGLLAAAALAAAPGCGPRTPDTPPGQALRLIQRCAETQTWGPMWDTQVSLERRKRVDRAIRRTLEKNEKYRSMAGDPSRDLFVTMFPMLLQDDTTFAFEAVADERIAGGRAEVRVRHRDGSTRGITLLAEDGWWKVDSAEGSEAFAPVGPGAESVDGYELR